MNRSFRSEAALLCVQTVLFLFLFLVSGAEGQTTMATPPSPSLQASQAQQQALAQSFGALMTQNPTPQQLEAWRQQNATALANRQQLALNLAADSALESLPQPGPPNIPAHASQTLKDFLTTQAALANARAQIHNQLLNALPAEVTAAQLGEMQETEAELFQQQQGANVQLQAQRAQTLADEAAQQPLPLPGPLSIPPGSTPQMAAFLTARDQLMRAQIQLQNQYVGATPAAREAALQQWIQQNAGRFQQVRQLAQNLSATGATNQN